MAIKLDLGETYDFRGYGWALRDNIEQRLNELIIARFAVRPGVGVLDDIYDNIGGRIKCSTLITQALQEVSLAL